MESVPLLAAEPMLAAELGNGRREEGLRVPVVRVPAGPWEPPRGEDGLAYLLCAGMLLRRARIEGGSGVELLGAGDCLMPWREEPASFSQPEWRAVERTRLAVLDLRPGAPLSRWPTIAATLAGRAIDRSRVLALQAAIMSVVGTEERLHALLWALAERWGQVGPDGAELEVKVPQSVLAEMVGARRQTVSQALGGLCERGLLDSSRPGRWLLKGSAPVLVGPEKSDC